MTFQQANSTPYVARVDHDYLTQLNADMLPWPAISPDNLPIQHVWDEMERRLRHLLIQSVTLVEMGKCLRQVEHRGIHGHL